LGPSFLCFSSRVPSVLPQAFRPERRIAHMDDGGGVDIKAAPAGLPIEGGDDPVIRSEEGPGNAMS
jgi:hypothetical protein